MLRYVRTSRRIRCKFYVGRTCERTRPEKAPVLRDKTEHYLLEFVEGQVFARDHSSKKMSLRRQTMSSIIRSEERRDFTVISRS